MYTYNAWVDKHCMLTYNHIITQNENRSHKNNCIVFTNFQNVFEECKSSQIFQLKLFLAYFHKQGVRNFYYI